MSRLTTKYVNKIISKNVYNVIFEIMSNTYESFNKSTYLVGFLAALIGLAAFKDALAGIKINVFTLNFSLLDAAIPMVVIMLLAAYLSALAQFLSNVTITRVPVSKLLNVGSNATAILALVYPILFGILLGGVKLVELVVNSTDKSTYILYGITALSAIFAIVTSLRSAIVINNSKREDELAKTLDQIASIKIKYDNLNRTNPYNFLEQYEELVESIVKYLKIRGYGIGGRGLLPLARILQSKNVYEARDVDDAAVLNKLRNNYAHGQKDIDNDELEKSIADIASLKSKVVDALYKLNISGEDETN